MSDLSKNEHDSATVETTTLKKDEILRQLLVQNQQLMQQMAVMISAIEQKLTQLQS